jgi:hypothetical protein
MRIREVASGIFVVRFRSQYELAATFLRFQEHYESPRFRNRVFSLEEFMDWYADRFGAFTYYEDWAGFNVPSTTFTAFYAGKFDPLLRKERRLLQKFRRRRAPFYVIGISDEQDLTHELAHALYFMRPAYKTAVRAALRKYNTSALRREIVAMGYHPSVATDEIHAYLIDVSNRQSSLRRYGALRRTLRAIYREHAAEFTGV